MSKTQLAREKGIPEALKFQWYDLPGFIVDSIWRVRSLRELKRYAVDRKIPLALWIRGHLLDVFSLLAVTGLLFLAWKGFQRQEHAKALIPFCLSSLTFFLWFQSYYIVEALVCGFYYCYMNLQNRIVRPAFHGWLLLLTLFLILIASWTIEARRCSNRGHHSGAQRENARTEEDPADATI